ARDGERRAVDDHLAGELAVVDAPEAPDVAAGARDPAAVGAELDGLDGTRGVAHEMLRRRNAREIPDAHEAVRAAARDQCAGRVDIEAGHAAAMPDVVDRIEARRGARQLAR